KQRATREPGRSAAAGRLGPCTVRETDCMGGGVRGESTAMVPNGKKSRAILARVVAATRFKGGPAVSLYVMLSTLSESGRKVLRERPGWIRKVNADEGRMGARVVAQYAVPGPYDFVTIVEAPDKATISRVSV